LFFSNRIKKYYNVIYNMFMFESIESIVEKIFKVALIYFAL